MIRPVVTGIGVVSPLGIGRKSLWQGLRQVRSGLRKITAFNTDGFRSNIAGQVADFDPHRVLPPRISRRMSRISRMAVVAAAEALQDAHLDANAYDPGRIAVVMGTCYGSSGHVEAFYTSLLREGPRGAQPFLFPETVPNAPASHIAMVHGLKGPNTTFCQNMVSSESALVYARQLLADGRADVVLAGGADELTAAEYAGYDALGALNPIRAENDPAAAPHPGKGLVLGEGAAVLVLETEAHARRRGCRMFGRLQAATLGGGFSRLGHYEERGSALEQAVRRTLEAAEIEPDQIDQVDVAANYTAELEQMEYRMLRSCFDHRRGRLTVVPQKYLMGESGAAGALRTAAVLLSLYRDHRLPCLDAEVLTGRLSLPLPWQTREAGGTGAVLMTAATFGGGCAASVFTRCS